MTKTELFRILKIRILNLFRISDLGFRILKEKMFTKSGFSVLEILIVLTIISIMFGAIVAMKSPFQNRMQLRNSALALAEDLRLAQAYAMGKREDYEYYGVRFYDDLGLDLLPSGESVRSGWKIVRYEPLGLVPPVAHGSVTIIKSSEVADNPEEWLDKTFFTSDRISIDATSDFRVADPPKLHSIVFNERGSATSDGDSNNLLTVVQDDIILTGFGHTITITITPLTGHIAVGDIQ